MAYETWILPRIHQSQFEECTPQQARAAGNFAQLVLQKIEAVLEQPTYNYIIHSAPFDIRGAAHYHWHIEVVPRITSTAGFEWGSGMFINAVPPEEAAARLRR
jgi:UDPglucose--hexose-1-phosphate uridylyltransferase